MSTSKGSTLSHQFDIASGDRETIGVALAIDHADSRQRLTANLDSANTPDTTAPDPPPPTPHGESSNRDKLVLVTVRPQLGGRIWNAGAEKGVLLNQSGAAFTRVTPSALRVPVSFTGVPLTAANVVPDEVVSVSAATITLNLAEKEAQITDQLQSIGFDAYSDTGEKEAKPGLDSTLVHSLSGSESASGIAKVAEDGSSETAHTLPNARTSMTRPSVPRSSVASDASSIPNRKSTVTTLPPRAVGRRVASDWQSDPAENIRISGLALASRWLFQGIVDMPVLARLAASRAFRVWVPVVLLTCGICVSVVRVSHPAALFTLVPLVWFSIFVTLSRFDRRILYALLTQFQPIYIICHLILFTVMEAWSSASTDYVWGVITYHLIIFPWMLMVIVSDSGAINSPIFLRISRFALCVVYGIYFFVWESMHDAFLEAHPVCFIFCTDTRRLAFVGLTQLLFFSIKFLYKTVVDWWRNRKEFVVLRFQVHRHVSHIPSVFDQDGFPLTITHVATPLLSELIDQRPWLPIAKNVMSHKRIQKVLKLSERQREAGLAAPLSLLQQHPETATPLVSSPPVPSAAATIPTLELATFADKRTQAEETHHQDQSAPVSAPESPALQPSRASVSVFVPLETLMSNRDSMDGKPSSLPAHGPLRNRLESQVNEVRAATQTARHHPFIHHAIVFRPLVSLPLLRRMSMGKYYRLYFAVSLICIVVLAGLQEIYPDSEAVNTPLALGAFIIAFPIIAAECTNFDRTLMQMIIRRFDALMVLGSAVQYTVFGVWSRWDIDGVATSLFGYFLWFTLHLIIVFMDAAPSYPRSVRVGSLVLSIANALRVFGFALFDQRTVNSIRVCIVFCGEARVLCYAGLLTVTIYTSRYLYNALFRPTLCLLLSSQVRYQSKVVRVPVSGGKSPQTL